MSTRTRDWNWQYPPPLDEANPAPPTLLNRPIDEGNLVFAEALLGPARAGRYLLEDRPRGETRTQPRNDGPHGYRAIHLQPKQPVHSHRLRQTLRTHDSTVGAESEEGFGDFQAADLSAEELEGLTSASVQADIRRAATAELNYSAHGAARAFELKRTATDLIARLVDYRGGGS